MGYCNAGSWNCFALPMTFPAETMRYTTPIMQRTIQLGTTNDYMLGYRFDIKPSGWNTRWRQETAAWESVYHEDGGGSRLIWTPLGNFNTLVP
jgi:hypothetical protein